MRRLISSLLLVVTSSAFVWAAPLRASVVPVKATHARVQRHHAHKAAKHRAPKHHHNRV